MLSKTRQKFDIPFDVIDHGVGKFFGALEDVPLSGGGTVDWIPPRRILKISPNLPVVGGMVIQTPMGLKYMVADHSASETAMGDPFKTLKLYQVTAVAQFRQRTSVIDPRTQLEREGVLSDPIDIYASFEPLQEAFDRELRIPNEKSRLITNHPVHDGDIINGQRVIEAHYFLGLYGAVLG